MDWAQAAGVSAVAGTGALASITIKDELHLPTKTAEPERHAELEAEARKSVLWEEVARFDGHALVEGVRTGRWSGEARSQAEALLARYGRRTTARAARLKRRAGFDEE